jgi:hypothetical protein
MLVAVNWSLKKTQPKVKDPEGWHQEWVPDTEAWPPYDPDFDIEEAIDEDILKSKDDIESPENENRVDAVGQNANNGLHYVDNHIPTAAPPPKEPSLGVNINEYVSPAKTIEQEIDELQHKPLNSLDRLNTKY